MQSTKSDVVRLLNQCNDSNPSCEFTLDNEFIHIEFSGDGKLHACRPEMKPHTVLLVEVFPKHLGAASFILINRDGTTREIPPQALSQQRESLQLDIPDAPWEPHFEIISGVVIRRTGQDGPQAGFIKRKIINLPRPHN